MLPLLLAPSKQASLLALLHLPCSLTELPYINATSLVCCPRSELKQTGYGLGGPGRCPALHAAFEAKAAQEARHHPHFNADRQLLDRDLAEGGICRLVVLLNKLGSC